MSSKPKTGVPAARENCDQALARLYAAYATPVFQWVRGLGVPSEAREDAVHDVFLAVHKSWDNFEGRSHERTWIYGITINIARRHRWKFRRREEKKARFQELRPSENENPDPFEVVRLQQSVELLENVLNRLTAKEREVYYSVEFADVRVVEFARLKNISESAAYSRLHKARKRFEKALRLELKHAEGKVP